MDLLSQVYAMTCFPRSVRNPLVLGPQAPKVSEAMGTKWKVSMSSAYFLHFAFSFDAAVSPGPFKEMERFEGATVQEVVQSQARFFPSFHVKVVRPSGF